MRCRSFFFVALAAAWLCAGCARQGQAGSIAARAEPGVTRVLFLTGGGYHDFEGNAAALMEGLGAQPDLRVRLLPIDPQGDASHELSDSALLEGGTDVILAYTQGELALSPGARAAVLAAIEGGVGFVGLHCTADSFPGWTAWDQMLGARFERHPPIGPLTVAVDVPEHPVTAGLRRQWALVDEFYHLKGFSPAGKDVLMTGISPEGGDRRPVTWAKTYGQGRVVYTILGHGREVHEDPRYRQLVAQALRWAGARPKTH